MLFYLFDSFFRINHVKKNSIHNSCELFYHTILHTTIKEPSSCRKTALIHSSLSLCLSLPENPGKARLLLTQVLCIPNDHVDDITCDNAQCIQDEIVNVRRPVGKRQLEYLNCQRHEKSGTRNLDEIIQAFIEHRQ